VINVQSKLNEYRQAQTLRAPYEQDWRMAAAHCWPRQYLGWQTVNGPMPTAHEQASATRRIAIDATGRKALPKFAAIVDRLSTPQSSKWQVFSADNRELMKVRSVAEYFDELTDIVYRERVMSRSKFSGCQLMSYMAMGCYGWYAKTITARRLRQPNDRPGLFYRARANRNVFILVDDEGEIVSVFNRMDLTAAQAKMKFGEDKLPTAIKADLERQMSDQMSTFEFVHVVELNPDYDRFRLDANRFTWRSYTICVKTSEIVGGDPGGVDGFMSNPWVVPRLFNEPEEVYAWSPAMQALPAMGTASAMKRTMLRVGQKQADPPLLSHDDGVLPGGRIDQRPGALNPGALNKAGQELVKPMRVGADFRPAYEALQDERKDINDTFLVTLFEILVETPEMTATQVLERVAEKAALLAPYMTRVQSEDLDVDTDRTLVVLAEQGRLPEPPPELIEADGEYQIIYSSPLAKQQRGEDVAGFARSLELAMAYAEKSGDASVLHHFDMDEAIPEVADIQGTPTRWIRAADEVARRRAADREQMQDQQMIEAAPAMTGAMKALQGANG
jgi:hypothetical protein